MNSATACAFCSEARSIRYRESDMIGLMRQASIHNNRLALNIGSGIGEQKRNDLRDLFGFAGAFERALRDEGAPLFHRDGREHVGFDGTGYDSVDAHAVRRRLPRP